MAAGSAGGAALLQSASEAAQRGAVQDSKALFAQAVAAASAENSLQLERDACLGLAEMAWQLSEHAEALAHYDRALLLSQQENNTEAQGMVLLGKGFALMNIGRAPEAAEALAACKELSSGNPAQERFVADLLMQAQAAALHEQESQSDNSAPASAVRPMDADASTQDAKGGAQWGNGAGAAASMEPQPDKQSAVSVEEVPDAPGMGGVFEHAVRAAFVKSVVLKECVVLVMEGSPSAAATPQQHAIAQALQQIRLRLHYIDTTNDAELAQDFVSLWAAPAQDVEHASESSAGRGSERQAPASGSEPTPDGGREEGKNGIQPLGGETLPLLFVGGKLFGGSVRIGGLRREGTENLKQAILDALPAHMNAQDRALLFTAPEVEMREWEPPAKHACGGHGVEGEDGESREACKTEHTERLRRLVSFVAAKVAGGLQEAWDAAAARYPRDDEAVLAFLSAPSSSSSSSSPGPPSADAAQVARSFIAELATTLGGLDLPHDLLQQQPKATAADIVNYIETVCPAQGDCNACPTKVTCQAHEHGEDGGSIDIEDAASVARDRIDIPKAARSDKSKRTSAKRASTQA